MTDTRNIGLIMIGAGVLLKSWLLAGAGLVIVVAVKQGTLPAVLPMPSLADPSTFNLTNGVNNGGSAVTPSPQLSVQAWPGAYEQ